jgi:ABC-type multidrug transport system fused ATPase/permease subunit
MSSYDQSNGSKIFLWLFISVLTLALGAAGSYMFLSAEPQQVSTVQQASTVQQQIIDRLSQLGERFEQLEQQRSVDLTADEPSLSSSSDEILVRLTQMADDLSSLSARIDELESGKGDLLAGSKGTGSEPKPFMARSQMTEEDILAEKMQREEEIAFLEGKLSMEEVDSDLGPRMDGALAEVLSTRGWSEQVNAATQCGSTMCRFEVEIPASMDATARFELENSVMMGMGKIMPSGAMIKYVNNADGSMTMTGYVGKTSGDLTR